MAVVLFTGFSSTKSKFPTELSFFFSFCLSLLALVLNIHHQCFVFLICEKFIEDKKKVLNVSLDARVMQR